MKARMTVQDLKEYCLKKSNCNDCEYAIECNNSPCDWELKDDNNNDVLKESEGQ